MKIKFPIQLKDIEFKLSYGPCYGHCPVYDLTIHGTGKVTFTGHDFVDVLGVQTTTVEAEVILQLIEAAMEIGFFEMKSNYDHEVIYEVLPNDTIDVGLMSRTDYPLKTLEIRIGKQHKKVKAYLGVPKRLDDYFILLNELSGAILWIGILSDEANA
jgi:hypothetical protein